MSGRPQARAWLASVVCLLLCAACGSGSGRAAPVLGAAEHAMDAAWSVDPSSSACVHENLELTCHYLYHGVHVAVAFDEHGKAEQISIDGFKHRSVHLWPFLNSLVPSGEHMQNCRYILHSTGGGAAHACIYQGKSDVIVAQFINPNDPLFGGLVAYDFAGYRDVERQG